MKTLCLYYSRTGTTRDAVQELAHWLDADVAILSDRVTRSYMSACLAQLTGRLPQLKVRPRVDFASYDRIVIGLPIWAESPCVIGKVFLAKYARYLPKELYILTTQQGTRDYGKKILKLNKYLKVPMSGYLSVREGEITEAVIKRFAAEIMADR